MLNRLHIQNYKCLLDVMVDLGEFTVLIGPNDSGKSSLLEVIRDLGRIVREPFHAVFNGDRALGNLVWRREAARDVVWDVTGTAGGDPFSYHVELPAGQRPPRESFLFRDEKVFWTDGQDVKFGPQGQVRAHVQPGVLIFTTFRQQPPYSLVAEALASTVEYHFDPEKLATASVPEPEAVLRADGSNLASVLDGLLSGADRTAFEAVEDGLHAAVPTLRGLALRADRNQPGAKALEFIIADSGPRPVTIPARLASNGALLLTAYLTLAYSPTPEVLLVEEPENGLHPSRLGLVIDLLRKIGTGEVGNRRRQVILTTHSPLLLNHVKPEDVRVFIRDPERGTQVMPMARVPDIDKLLKEFSTGELWYLLGEDKLVSGSPA